jgi:predicted phosphodiesterase
MSRSLETPGHVEATSTTGTSPPRRARNRLSPMLIIPDVHAPFHHVDAWALMMDVAHDLQPETIVVIGDFLDMYAVSSHSKDPARIMRLEDELAVGKRLRGQLDDLGAARKVFLEGNHEDRLRRYLQDKAPELYGVVDVSSLLELDAHGWEFTSYRDHTRLGAVHYTHDVGKTGRYSTYQTLDQYQHSVVFGHSHRLSYVVEGNATGEAKVAAQFGWLGDVEQIDYMARAKARKDWALGFGIGHTDSQTGHTFLSPVPIVHDRCVVNGKLYKAPAKRRRRTR